MPGSPEGEQPRPFSSDQSKPSVEGGKSPAGLPSARKDQTKTQRDHTPTPPDSSTRQQPRLDTSDLVLNSVMREWAEEDQRHRELEVFKEITKGKSFGFTPEESAAFAAALNAASRTPNPSEVKEPTPEELDRMAEEELTRLKSLKTMTSRIDHALFYWDRDLEKNEWFVEYSEDSIKTRVIKTLQAVKIPKPWNTGKPTNDEWIKPQLYKGSTPEPSLIAKMVSGVKQLFR